MIRVGLITTLGTNIGDDFIREGICRVVRRVFDGQKVRFVPVNKHRPLTAYPGWHPARLAALARRLPRGRAAASRLVGRMASPLGRSVLDGCRLIVQCGAPVFWPGCHRCEWAGPLWRDVVGRLHARVPVLNLAAGSCYPWQSQPDEITDGNDARFLRSILGWCRLTTVRDALAQRLCAHLGARVPMIPCAALLAAGAAQRADGGGARVLMNFMDGGGHYEWGQGIDPAEWTGTARALVGRLKAWHSVAFLCHDKAEFDRAGELDPELPRVWPKTVEEYFRLCSGAGAAVCNRMHAAVGLAGMGIPSVAVGTDTRLLMVDALGLPCFYVTKTNVELLEDAVEGLLSARESERDRLLALRSETWDRYVEAVSGEVLEPVQCESAACLQDARRP